MPGKIQFFIKRHVLFRINLFWLTNRKKVLIYEFSWFLVKIFHKMPHKSIFLQKIRKYGKIENRDVYFFSYLYMTLSYIFPQIRTSYLKICRAGQLLKLWKNAFLGLTPNSLWVIYFYIFRMFEIWAPNATNQTPLSFLVQDLIFLNIEKKPTFIYKWLKK